MNLRGISHLWRSLLGLAVIVLIGALIGWGKPPPPASESVRGFDVFAQQSGFATVTHDYRPHYPQDMVSHPAFATEWWYLTATLSDRSGQEYGVQWTLFRRALHPSTESGWASQQLYMAHVAITRGDKQWEAERFARGGIGQAGVTLSPFQAWLDDWQWLGGDQPLPAQVRASLPSQNTPVGFSLQVADGGLRVKQGDKGYSVRHANQPSASYYFSLPQLMIKGQLTLDGETIPVTGKGWFDKEWSSGAMAKGQTGWDWFGLNLDDGRALMVTQIRGTKPFVFGSLAYPNGRVVSLHQTDIKMLPVSHAKMTQGASLPIGWQIKVPGEGIDITTQPLNVQSWMDLSIPYWEGPVRVKGSTTGRGFMEATGY
ncbi:lipocalin-like domain-containing protein [Salinivibrio sp. ES.052]|uniref:lipocalin-like domain-containing protein n=1 Tax=Salinivibrio sp. ES.052 TaxID=1882823 RepID=UPI000940F74A|nr:lipocalin-like domain-containing protein [Salinivibrio sp. ES.052]